MRYTAALAALTLVAILAWGLLGGAYEPRPSRWLPLHTLMETCSIVVCALVFVVARASMGTRRNRNMTLLGAAFLGVALLHFLHAQSYLGMPDLVTPSGPEKAINFWLAARLLAAGALLATAWLDWEETVPAGRLVRWSVIVLAGVSVLTWIFLYLPHWIPRTFEPGRGLTPLKVWIELVVSAMCAMAAWGYYRLAIAPRRSNTLATGFDPLALLAATLVMAQGGVFFMVYNDVFGVYNLLGHVYMVVAACLLCRGLVARNLYEVEARAMLALDAADLGSWSWDVASDRITFDLAARSHWCLTDDAPATMQRVEASIHPEDLAARQAAIRSALDPAGNGMYRVEYRVVRPSDGSVRLLASQGRTLFRDGRPERVVGIVRDVTERRNAEQAVRHSEARLSGILAIAADAIISIDDRYRITLFNNGAERIFGYAAAEVIGGRLDVLLPERLRAAHEGHIRGFAGSDTPSRLMGERREIFGRRKDGTEFPAEASISKLDVDGEWIFTVVLRDITARHEVERRLAEVNQSLELRVAERTRQLEDEMARREVAQAALAKAQRMEAFGQLSGGIAHDFNNLLTVIKGNQELLEMRLRDEKDLALLKRAQEAADMGARLTSRMLTFARRRPLAPTIINLNDQVSSMAELLRRSIGDHVTLTTNFAPHLGAIRADASEIENAILNLAINARDAMPSGGSLVIETDEVRVAKGDGGLEEKLPPGRYVRLSVSDTGTGMKPEVLARAFDPFFTTKEPGKGTGLGLSTIYGFVQQLGGVVTIYSEIGRGSTVSIYLPRVDGGTVGGWPDKPDEDIPRAAGQRVLLVEDNEGVREVARRHLAELGYAVAEAVDGREAVALLSEGRAAIDVVFSDVVMPGGMSGYDLAVWLAEHRPAIKVLLTSGYPDEVARSQGGRLPSARLLRKPYSRAELARALQGVLSSAPPAG